ncbi:MAG: hypothetical protein IJW13_00610 [Clostridia bacterium]|nr:hypothetical protein [Clostridia bacterium]
MENKKNNAKCPFCGAELYVGYEKGTGICTVCKKQFNNEKAVKLYKSIYEQPKEEEKKVAKGEDYLEVERILTRAEFHFKRKDFEKAKTELESALKITTTDYRVYFGMVRVHTSDLTDYRNTTHQDYLNKAIQVADSEEKSVIMRLYKDFYQISKLSDEEINQYKAEENEAIKQKLEKKLKELIPFYIKKEKSLKTYLIFAPLLLVIGIGVIVSAIILGIDLLFAGGVIALFGGYMLGRLYFNHKKEVKLFNGFLDFYDEYVNFNFSILAGRTILDCMKVCRENFAEKGNLTHIEQGLSTFCREVLKSGSEQARRFLLSHEVLGYYAKAFE